MIWPGLKTSLTKNRSCAELWNLWRITAVSPDFFCVIQILSLIHILKAGLTGYAQVYGKYNTTPYDKLKLDLFYIENYSFLLDIKLLFMTVKIFFQKEVSEGVDDNQKNALKDSEDKK